MFFQAKKRISYWTIITCLCPSIFFAQDIITKKDGAEIPCKVIELDPPKIKYRPSDHSNGPIRTLYYKEVFMIKYENGTKEVLSESRADTENNNSHTTTSPKKYNIKPWAIGVGGTVVASARVAWGGWLSASYTFSPVPFRLQLDGSLSSSVGRKYYYHPLFLASANFSLQYVIALGGGTVELAPEIGLGIYHQGYNGMYNTNNVLMLLGAALDFRLTKWLSLRLNTRYRTTFAENDKGAFEGHLGVRFLLGNHKQQ